MPLKATVSGDHINIISRLNHIALKHIIDSYNLKADHIEKLDGYLSDNYKIQTPTGSYVLKHYRDMDDYNFTIAEMELLTEIADRISFQIPSSAGTIKTFEDQTFTRLIPFIDGQMLSGVEHSDSLLLNFGKSIGELNTAFSGKRNDSIAARRLSWDMQYTLSNMPKMKYIEHPNDRKIVHYFFDQFQHHVLPLQHTLRHSIIHSDLNDNNVVVKDQKIAGFIDFGDMCYAPLIYEIAIAITYIMLTDKDDPFLKAQNVLKGYHSVLPLYEEEIKLLYYLIPARLCVSVCYASEARHKGTDTEYILIHEKSTWKLLHKWIQLNPLWVQHSFLSHLGFPTDFPRSDDILSTRKKLAGASLSLSYDDPIYMTGAAFQYMFDNMGNTYLDARNNIPHVGHCHPKISQILSDSVRRLNTNTRYLYPEFTTCASALIARLPKKLCKVFFVNSGSAATDLAIRMAQTHTRQRQIAVIENGYHGNTITGIDVSSYKFEGKGGQGKANYITKLPLPQLYKGLFADTASYVNNAQEIIDWEIDHGRFPAALIAEPISGCGGQVPLADGYLKMLTPFLSEKGILMIIDEVQTGFGRLGKYFWGFEMHHIIPDIVVLGKPMGNGHPIAAVVTTEEIADSFANGMEFFSSFGGNPVSCATCTSVLEIIAEEELKNNALEVGNYMLSALRKLKTKFNCIGDIRGIGLFLGIAFVNDQEQPNGELAQWVKDEMKASYILLGTDGPQDSVIKIKPPMCFSKENALHLVTVLERILLQYQQQPLIINRTTAV